MYVSLVWAAVHKKYQLLPNSFLEVQFSTVNEKCVHLSRSICLLTFSFVRLWG